jgi:hypothetical protein
MKKHTKKRKINRWKVSSFALSFLLIVSIIIGNSGIPVSGTTGNAVAENAIEFINTNLLQGQATAELGEVTNEEGLVKAEITVMDQTMNIYMTKNGNLLFLQAINMAEQIEVPVQPTADRPKAELYVWSYCPYGVMAQGPFIEAVRTLSDSIDYEVVLYHAGHGDYELQQNKIQAVIQKYYPELYLDYAEGFVEEIYPLCNSRGTGITERTSLECDLEESTKIMEALNINVTEVFKLVDEEGEELFNLDRQKASNAQVTGSPSLVLNDFKVQEFARTAEGIKNAICGGFNELPISCEEELANEEEVAAGNC